MMGIPRSDVQQIFELTNTILGVGDPEYVQTLDQLMAAGMGCSSTASRSPRTDSTIPVTTSRPR